MVEQKMRSFIAIDIKDEAVKMRLTEAQRRLEATGADLKLVAPENIHITIRFLGEISQAMVEKVISTMNEIDFVPFEVEFAGLGAFPNLNRINVVWVGIRTGAKELAGMFDQLEPRLRRLGLPADDKGFSPHVTLARARSGRGRAALSDAIGQMGGESFGKILVNSLALKKSVLTPKGPIYSTLYSREVHA